jgi:hypothetical protein
MLELSQQGLERETLGGGLAAVVPGGRGVAPRGGGLHSFTFQLNESALYLKGVRLGFVQRVFKGCQGIRGSV